MSTLLAAKPKLPEGFIDVSVGEAHVVREVLDEVFSLYPYDLPNVKGMHEYPLTAGYEPLVHLLEQKHGGKVIVTNGAKQALAACFYAVKSMGHDNIAMKSPYWALMPALSDIHNVKIGLDYLDKPTETLSTFPYLLVAPNNPDGYCPSADELQALDKQYKDNNVPLIHDAAYYNHTYLAPNTKLVKVGDVQIFSISKMLGLSGLRLGYVVCHNDKMYELIKAYVEHMTVGCSMLSQIYLHDLLNRMKGYPTLREKFEAQSYNALQESKKIALTISKEVLEVPDNLLDIPGMFLWAKVGPKADFNKSKINVITGELFGGSSEYVRINLAFNKEKMQNIVDKLNEAAV